VSDGRLVVASNANETLDEADAATDGFLAAAREFAAANPDVELAAEESAEPKAPRPGPPSSSLWTCEARTSRRSSGRPDTTTTG